MSRVPQSFDDSFELFAVDLHSHKAKGIAAAATCDYLARHKAHGKNGAATAVARLAVMRESGGPMRTIQSDVGICKRAPRLIMVYGMCGFANSGSLGIMIGRACHHGAGAP